MFGLLGGKAMVMLGFVVVGLIALAIVARNWSCRQPRHPRDPRTATVQRDVVRAESGASLIVQEGRRRKREQIVILENIEAPTGPLAEASRANLEKLAGASVIITYVKHGLFRDDGSQIEGTLESDESEASGPLTGVVVGSGVTLNLAQVEAGLATCQTDAPKDWKAAQTKAQGARLGVWKR